MDSVEIVLCWEESLCIAVPDKLAYKVTTPAESVELLSTLVKVRSKDGACLKQVAFHLIRNTLMNEFKIPRSQIKSTSRISALFPKKGQQHSWNKFKHAIGFNKLTVIIGFPLFGAGSTKIDDVVTEIVAFNASSLIDPRQGWAISQIREVVRASVVYVVGLKEFSDYDHYVKDIGIN